MRPEIVDLEAFVDLSKSRSFTETAARLRVDRTVVSKRIQRLESALGVRVLERTTRSVRLTEEGAFLLQQAKQVFEGFQVISDLFSRPLAPKGVVKISAPVTVSVSLLSRVLPTIRSSYPGVQIELMVTDRVLNFVEEGLDLTLRSGMPEDSAFVGRKLVENELIFAASPQYLKRVGAPTKISDLKSHSLLFHDFHRNTAFRKARVPLREFESCRSIVCNDNRVLNRLAEEGAGICIRPKWDLEQSLSAGRLREVLLPDNLDDRTSLYLLYPKSALLPQRTQVVIDAIELFFKKLSRKSA